jgi:hypothetical protein
MDDVADRIQITHFVPHPGRASARLMQARLNQAASGQLISQS